MKYSVVACFLVMFGVSSVSADDWQKREFYAKDGSGIKVSYKTRQISWGDYKGGTTTRAMPLYITVDTYASVRPGNTPTFNRVRAVISSTCKNPENGNVINESHSDIDLTLDLASVDLNGGPDQWGHYWAEVKSTVGSNGARTPDGIIIHESNYGGTYYCEQKLAIVREGEWLESTTPGEWHDFHFRMY